MYHRTRQNIGGPFSAIKVLSYMTKADASSPGATRLWLPIVVSIFALFLSCYQLYLSRKATHIDQRAWVTIPSVAKTRVVPGEGIDAGKSFMDFEVHMASLGKTPATNFYACGWIEINPTVEPDLAPTRDRCRNFQDSKTAQYSPLFSNAPPSALPMRTVALAVDDFAEIDAKKKFVFLLGTIWYDDVFEHSHWVKFCWRYLPDDAQGRFNVCGDRTNDLDSDLE